MIRFSARVRQEWAARRANRSLGPGARGTGAGPDGRGGASPPRKSRVVLVGAGQAGCNIARELNAHPELPYAAVGFLDDDPAKQGCIICGLKVLGTISDLSVVARRLRVEQVLVAMPSAPGPAVKRVFDACSALKIGIKTIPGIYELLDGKVTVNRLRTVEIHDLLRREEVHIDLERAAGYLRKARVLVTGAGGSIGSELCRQIGRMQPAERALLGHGEFSIYEILGELHDSCPEVTCVPVIADVRDARRIGQVFDEFRPDVVFHAAAHKHVHLMELCPDEALATNVLGTWIVARAASQHGVDRFVSISTDKAVNPVSAMGQSKRCAETVVRMFSEVSRTRFVVVRFGNVLGSRGSVVPRFKKQIAKGGPVTVTHPDMTRYFMTIPEAVQLVIQAAAFGTGGRGLRPRYGPAGAHRGYGEGPHKAVGAGAR